VAIEFYLFNKKSKRYLSARVSFNNPSISPNIGYIEVEEREDAMMFWEKQWAEEFLQNRCVNIAKKEIAIIRYEDVSYDWD
jgi:hypothetical protein